MKSLSLDKPFLTALFALPLAGALALAPAPALAEQPSSDYSAINGQLVPVGDHNQYRYSHPRWNVSTNPVGWVAGSYGASVSYAFHSNFALRADANYFNEVGGDDHGLELGLGLPIYFRRAYQGFFLEPGAMYRRTREAPMAAVNTVGPQVLAGWHWIWDSGLNVAVALGGGRNFSSTTTRDDQDDLFVNGYVRFGYAF
jgi:hypothetical protein